MCGCSVPLHGGCSLTDIDVTQQSVHLPGHPSTCLHPGPLSIFQAPDQPARPFTTAQVTLDSNPDHLLLHQVDDQTHLSFQSIPSPTVVLSQHTHKPSLLTGSPPFGHRCELRRVTLGLSHLLVHLACALCCLCLIPPVCLALPGLTPRGPDRTQLRTGTSKMWSVPGLVFCLYQNCFLKRHALLCWLASSRSGTPGAGVRSSCWHLP